MVIIVLKKESGIWLNSLMRQLFLVEDTSFYDELIISLVHLSDMRFAFYQSEIEKSDLEVFLRNHCKASHNNSHKASAYLEDKLYHMFGYIPEIYEDSSLIFPVNSTVLVNNFFIDNVPYYLVP